MSTRIALLCLALTLAACSSQNPVSDAGAGGGSGGSSGGSNGGGTGGGTGGSGGGGSNPNDECDFGGPRNCMAGSACILTVGGGGVIAKRCSPGACDLIDQGCDGGFKCGYLDGGRTCLPDGTLNEGQACAGAPVGCRAGLACTLVGNDGGSTCARFCRLDTDCGSPQRCYVTLQLPDSNERPLICANPPLVCDPLVQDCVDMSEGCYPGSSGPGCFPAGPGTVGSTCMYSNDCGKGFACNSTSATCKRLCGVVSGMPSCGDAGTCTRLVSSMTVGMCL